MVGTITTGTVDVPTGGLQHPLDMPVIVTGSHSQGEWIEFTHNLGPNPQSLHPVKVYGANYSTLYGIGKYALPFQSFEDNLIAYWSFR